MKIVSIFEEHLTAFQYHNEAKDEMSRLFHAWHNPEYLHAFFNKNVTDLKSGFYEGISVDAAIEITRTDAIQLENALILNGVSSLDKIFVPLDNIARSGFERSKLRGSRYPSWLRIYALKIDPNAYVITGGAIKLTRKMQERPHTQIELNKLVKCKDFLQTAGVVDIDGFRELYL